MNQFNQLRTRLIIFILLLIVALPVLSISSELGMTSFQKSEENDSIRKLPVIVEAESGNLGDDLMIDQDGAITYITATASNLSNTPRDSARISTYEVTFADTGYYCLFARVFVGPETYNDDSYFVSKDFGEYSPTVADDWLVVNNLATAGFTKSDDVVDEYGTVGSEIWKWVNITKNFYPGEATEKALYVGEDTLKKTFQIASREDGLLIDKLAFGKYELYYTVNDLDSVLPGSTEWPGDSSIFYPGPPIAEGSPKFLGNLMARNDNETFRKIWNQITPENEGKWASVGTSLDTNQWNWGGVQNLYNYAKSNNIIFKFHTLIWGSQQPSWIDDLTPEQQLMYIESWIRQVGQRFPDIELVDVVNEALPGHNPPDGQGGRANYKEALGGDGETGWDWVIKSFELARKYLPNSKLLINDYGIVSNIDATTQYIELIQLLNERGLIDGIGIQSHRFSIQNGNVETMKYNLDRMAATGLPIYPSEMDMGDNDDEEPFDDQLQLETYQRVFPIFWEHPSVAGITIWGYKMPVWQETSHLINEDGSWRPTLKWLKEYIAETPVVIDLVDTSDYTNAYFEAECGTVGEHWDIISDDMASNEHYVTMGKDGINTRNSASTEAEDYIIIPFSVDTAGTYSINARVKCPSISNDSYWVKIDDEEFQMINGLTTTSWDWVTLMNATIDKGDHTLVICYRERGALLDKLCVTNFILPPSGMGDEAVNVCTLPVTSVNDVREVEFVYNYPNPFNSTTTISFGIPETANVNLKIFDIYGREITTLVNENLTEGVYNIEWDATSSNNGKLVSGAYFYRLVYGNSVVTKKMLLK